MPDIILPDIFLPRLYRRRPHRPTYLLPRVSNPLIFSTAIPHPTVPLVNLLLSHTSVSACLLLIIQFSSKSPLVLFHPSIHPLVRTDRRHHHSVIHHILCLPSPSSIVCPTYPSRLYPPPPSWSSPASLLATRHHLLCPCHLLTCNHTRILLCRVGYAVTRLRNAPSPPPPFCRTKHCHCHCCPSQLSASQYFRGR